MQPGIHLMSQQEMQELTLSADEFESGIMRVTRPDGTVVMYAIHPQTKNGLKLILTRHGSGQKHGRLLNTSPTQMWKAAGIRISTILMISSMHLKMAAINEVSPLAEF